MEFANVYDDPHIHSLTNFYRTLTSFYSSQRQTIFIFNLVVGYNNKKIVLTLSLFMIKKINQ